MAGNAKAAAYLQIAPVPRAGEVTVFCTAIAGASLGFLWFNAHPAEMFMGDVGSLALGGAIGTVAVLCKQELLLILVGGLFSFMTSLQEASAVLFLSLGGWETIPVGIRNFIGNYQERTAQLMAAGVVSTLPVLIAFFATQRWLVRGLTAGAVKG